MTLAAAHVRDAVDRRALVGLHQPVRALDGGPDAVELVLGLPGAEAGAQELMRAAHRLGLAQQVDALAVRTGLALLGSDALDQGAQLLVGVSATSPAVPAFLLEVEAALASADVAPGRLVLVLDTTATWSFSSLRYGAERLRHRGLRLGLDGFGASPDAFLLLTRLPVDLVRVDGCFVPELATRQEDQQIVRSLTAQAHGAGCRVLVPEVRDGSALRLLASLGVDLASGPHVGAPRRREPHAA